MEKEHNPSFYWGLVALCVVLFLVFEGLIMLTAVILDMSKEVEELRHPSAWYGAVKTFVTDL